MLGVFLLGLAGLSIPSSALAAKPYCGDGTCQGKERDTCPKDCGEEVEVAGYDVFITGAVSGGSIVPWIPCNQRGGKCLDGLDGDGHLSLDFFMDGVFPFFDDDDAVDCFGILGEVVLSTQMAILKGRGGCIDGMFWFEGRTVDGTMVLYALFVFGNIIDTADLGQSDELPPPSGEVTSIAMTHWDMTGDGDASCIGEGTFVNGPMFIDVEEN